MTKNLFVRTYVIPVMVLIIVCPALFFNSFSKEFLWDDHSLIPENRHIRDYRNIPLFLTPHYWNELHTFGGQFRPVRAASLAVDYYFWKLNPVGYHVTNLLLHTINVVLIYLLVLTIDDGRRNNNSKEGPFRYLFPGLPFLTAFFFAAHPIHIESVVFIKNRSDLLAFLFFLVSLLLFIKSAAGGRALRALLVISAWLCFIPAILSKEMALTLPGVLLLYAGCFMTGPERRKALIRIVPYVLIVCAFFWFMNSFIKPEKPAPANYLPADTGQHVLTVIKTMGVYFRMLIAPVGLNAEHSFKLPESVLDPAVLLALIVPLAICLWAVRTRQGVKMLLFAFGWILLTLLPGANIVFLASRPIAEQRLYIPSFGFCLLLGYGLERLSRVRTRLVNPARAAMAGGLLAIVIVGLYAAIDVRRNDDWRDGLTFYSRTVAANPNSARMHNNLGTALSGVKRYEEAVSHYMIGLSLEPYNPETHNNLGSALDNMGRSEEAIDYYKNALRLKPTYAKAHNNLGVALSKTGKKQEAVHQWRESVRLQPDYPEALNNLGAELSQEGRFDEAISHYQAALKLEPGYAKAHNNLGLALAATEQDEKAVSHFQQAVSSDPNYAEAHINLGVALDAVGRPAEAIRYFEIALRLDPNHARAHNNLGGVLVKTGRIEEAISHYFSAIRLDPGYARALNNLGAVLVETGQAGEAVGHYWASLLADPDDTDTYLNLGRALVKTGQTEEILQRYLAAPGPHPDMAGVYTGVGETFVIQGRIDKALQYFQKALKISPEHIRAQRAFQECLENKSLNSVESD